ncbi:hypothetical protein COV93_02975 [Candidatus Woesearchaeota archaeon CG11_big_fil_rev_8_21_14_0_20_43_8]|nr:MAG: hypothetical protein COV93_02975 [Candidatus Woesearchaeota archaeon CG11_big_fil_rev_8_21_14_0_20_43_8]
MVDPFKRPKKDSNTILVIFLILAGLGLIIARPSIFGNTVLDGDTDEAAAVNSYKETVIIKDDPAKADLNSRLLVADTNLSSCISVKDDLISFLEKANEKLSLCNAELSSLKTNISMSNKISGISLSDLQAKLKTQQAECKKDLEEKESELEDLDSIYDKKFTSFKDDIIDLKRDITDLENNYNALANNTANNICCKARVDNPKISAFKISDDRVVCLEEGNNRLNC